jgi:hypothetical protein
MFFGHEARHPCRELVLKKEKLCLKKRNNLKKKKNVVRKSVL